MIAKQAKRRTRTKPPAVLSAGAEDKLVDEIARLMAALPVAPRYSKMRQAWRYYRQVRNSLAGLAAANTRRGRKHAAQ